MDFQDTPIERDFRLSFRNRLADHNPGPVPDHGESLAEHQWRRQWHQTLYAGGWLGLSWPERWGGREMSPIFEAIINEELGVANIRNSVGQLGWLGRALLLFGNDEQRQRLLVPMLRGETSWCQGFSEPGAGSDLASLSTSARRDGDRYVINGQKLWTSGAQFADYCMVLVRTDRQAPKHRGITCLVVRMDAPGITVNPLRQSWGGERFCEVFFDDAEARVSDRLGEEGGGWRLATTVLSYERGPSEVGMVAIWRSELGQPASSARGLRPWSRCPVGAGACGCGGLPYASDGEPDGTCPR